jgi:dUTP pyrophosphatase
MLVKYKKINENAKEPTKSHEDDACFDLYASEYHMLFPSDTIKVGTGLAVEIPKGYCLKVIPRSGLSSKNIIILNSPGTIDANFRGEVKIILRNIGIDIAHINIGDRVAQCELKEVIPLTFGEVEELSVTDRGEGGFGSTGI